MESLGVTEKIITLPDLGSADQNRTRDEILGRYRGWKHNQYLFSDFPKSVAWYEVELTPKEIEKLKYINYSYWVKMSGGSRLVKDAACNIRQGRTVFGESNQRFFKVAKEIEGGYKFPEMILVAEDEKTTPVILEGHLRATAYVLSRKKPKIIKALLGVDPSIKEWANKQF